MAQDGIRRRGGALFGELKRLDLMRESGALSDESYSAARARLMRSVTEADIAEQAPEARAAAPGLGAGAALTLGAVGLAMVAMVGASPEVLACVCVAALATVGLAVAWGS
jgi:hypothetical protein